MRGAVPGLPSRTPLLERLPGILQEDEFLQRFVPAFDDGLAPILATLDSLETYVDPALAPEDFLDWLAGWVGIELDDAWDLAQRREVIAAAAQVQRRAGTLSGVRDALALGLGASVEADDSGGCTWSAAPGGPLPGTSDAVLTVRISVADPSSLDPRRVHALLDQAKPAHVRHVVEVVSGGAP